MKFWTIMVVMGMNNNNFGYDQQGRMTGGTGIGQTDGTSSDYSEVSGGSGYDYRPQQSDYSAPIYMTDPSGNTTAIRPYSQPRNDSGKKRFIAGIALGVAASLLIGGIGYIIGRSGLNRGAADAAADKVNILVAETPVNEIVVPQDNATPLTYSQIAAKVGSGVVGITCYTDAYGWGSMIYSQGSGFIISDSGYIVTNAHVINDDKYTNFKITATIADKSGESKEVEVSVVGYDTKTDLAVLKFDPAGLDFTVCELGQSSALILGEEVVAIGNPGGEQFAGSVTNGIISGLDRVIDEDTGANDTAIKYIQTNAAINPGNSGGPLLNMYGQVIGINTSKIIASGYEGLGFSIPIEDAKPIIEQLIEVGHVLRPAVGLKLWEISEQNAAWYDVPQGLLIKDMATNSSCVGKDVQINDIIVGMNGEEVKTLNDFQNVIDKCKVGDTVTLTLFRLGGTETFDVEIVLISDVEANYAQNGTRP